MPSPSCCALLCAVQLKLMDEEVLRLSRLLAARTLQLEMEYIYRSLEEEALDIAGSDMGGGCMCAWLSAKCTCGTGMGARDVMVLGCTCVLSGLQIRCLGCMALQLAVNLSHLRPDFLTVHTVHTHALSRTRTHTHTHALTHAYIHTYRYADAHMHTHTCSCIHTLHPQSQPT